jgi:hypothetical protein
MVGMRLFIAVMASRIPLAISYETLKTQTPIKAGLLGCADKPSLNGYFGHLTSWGILMYRFFIRAAEMMIWSLVYQFESRPPGLFLFHSKFTYKYTPEGYVSLGARVT